MSSDKYRVCKVGRLYAVQWTLMDLEGLEAVEEDLKRFIASRPQPPIYAPITDAGTAPPDEPTKKRMVKMAEDIVPSLRAFYIVISTTGFRASVHRGALAGMMLLTKLRGKVHVVQSMEEVLASEGPTGLGIDTASVRAALQREGLSTPRAAAE